MIVIERLLVYSSSLSISILWGGIILDESNDSIITLIVLACLYSMILLLPLIVYYKRYEINFLEHNKPSKGIGATIFAIISSIFFLLINIYMLFYYVVKTG